MSGLYWQSKNIIYSPSQEELGYSFDFSPDGKYLAIGAPGRESNIVDIYNVGTDFLQFEIESEPYPIASRFGTDIAMYTDGYIVGATAEVYRQSLPNDMTHIADVKTILLDLNLDSNSKVSSSNDGKLIAYANETEINIVSYKDGFDDYWEKGDEDLDHMTPFSIELSHEADIHDMAMSASGEILVCSVGPSGESVYIYEWHCGHWYKGELKEDDNNVSAYSIALDSNGSCLAIGNPDSESVVIYKKNADSAWLNTSTGDIEDPDPIDCNMNTVSSQTILPTDQPTNFGYSIALSNNGDKIVVGSIDNIDSNTSKNIRAYVYNVSSSNFEWAINNNTGSQYITKALSISGTTDLTKNKLFNVAITNDDTYIAIGSGYHDNNKGTIQIYHYEEGTPTNIDVIDTTEPPLTQDPESNNPNEGVGAFGDPYIIPYKGRPNKLPDKKGFYSLFKYDDIMLNCFVDKMNIKTELMKYIEHMDIHYDKNKLITEGYWNKAYWLSSEGHDLTIMMNNGSVKLTGATDYYKITEKSNAIASMSKKEILLGGEISMQVEISWVHSVHGKQNVKLNLYANPQVQNGIVYDTPLYNEKTTQGLLARSMSAKAAELKCLNDVKSNNTILKNNNI